MSLKNSKDKVEKNNLEEDIVYENDAFDDDFKNKQKKLKTELKKVQLEKEEYLQGWQRSQADYANLKKRCEEEKNTIRKYGSEKIILDIIKVIDNFEMAFKDQDSWNKASENWRIGIETIYNQLISVIKDNDVIILNPTLDLFDPNNHHCVEVVKVENQNEDGIITEVIQKGYQLGEKNIRPAMVKVGKFEN